MMNEEMITKAKEAKSVEELITLAKENGVELNEEDAKKYFEQLNAKKGELPDDELDDVAGGMIPAGSRAPCPKCKTQGRSTGLGYEYKCPNCGCRWDYLTGEILN